MTGEKRDTAHRMAVNVDLGPPVTADGDWFFTPRPAKNLDAAEITIVEDASGSTDAPPHPSEVEGNGDGHRPDPDPVPPK